MPPSSAVIIALDCASKIGLAVASVRPFVDEVLVLDGGSTDATVDVARAAGARVVAHPFDGFVSQKRRAVALARHDGVFLLDSDEIVDPELGRSLHEACRSALPPAGFLVSRRNYLDGVALRASGWGRDRPLRLFDRRMAGVDGVDPHDRVVARPGAALLRGVLHHDPQRGTAAYVRGTVRHARSAARSLARSGRPGPWAPALHGLAHLLRKLVLGFALMDGRRGLTVAWVGAKGVERKYRLARRLSA